MTGWSLEEEVYLREAGENNMESDVGSREKMPMMVRYISRLVARERAATQHTCGQVSHDRTLPGALTGRTGRYFQAFSSSLLLRGTYVLRTHA